MALTKHEQFHLNAILEDQEEIKKNSDTMEKFAIIKGKTSGEYLKYLDGVKADVDKILDSGVFPGYLSHPSDIVDHLEGGS